MKKIGFIDYYISEWHANNYPKWFTEASKRIGEDFKVAYAYAELDVSPVDQVTTDEWCKSYGVERCYSIEELCEKSDYICILAPSNPEKHLGYVKEAFKCGKNTYVDKTFSDDYQGACEIFRIGKEYNTSFFSTSALRYATELSCVSGANSLITTGCGSNFDEYIIHQCEMVIKTLGCDLKLIKGETLGENQHVIKVEFESGKSAAMVFSPAIPFAICASDDGKEPIYKTLESDYFAALLEDILKFYLSGKAPFNSDETLAVMKLREAAIKVKTGGTVNF